MSVEEIFIQLCTHMKTGVNFHEKVMKAFYFLSLKGYGKCHEYHYYEENYNLQCIYNFYLKNYNKLLLLEQKEDIEVFPQTWHKYFRQEVDQKTRKESINMLIKKWIEWEKEAKQLIENSYRQLYELGEIFAASFLLSYIDDTGKELQQAENMLLALESMSYDMPTIIIEQENLYKKYAKKLKKIYEDDEQWLD